MGDANPRYCHVCGTRLVMRDQREGGQDEAGSCVCRGRRRPSAAQERRADAHKSGDQQDGAWR